MIGGHLGEIYRLCKNFSDQERQVVLLTMPTKMLEEEIERRNNHYNDLFSKLYEILESSEIETLDQAEDVIKLLRSTLRVK